MQLPDRLAFWQAWRSPASLGFPLSVPSACGCHEIDHLKMPYHSTRTIAQLFRFVKNFLGSQISIVSLGGYLQEGYDRVFVSFGIAVNRQSQNQLKTVFFLREGFEQKCRIGFVCLQNVVRLLNDGSYVFFILFEIVWMPAFYVLYSFDSYYNFVRNNVFGYTFVFANIDSRYKLHAHNLGFSAFLSHFIIFTGNSNGFCCVFGALSFPKETACAPGTCPGRTASFLVWGFRVPVLQGNRDRQKSHHSCRHRACAAP